MQTNKQIVRKGAGLIGLLAGLAATMLPAPAQFTEPPTIDYGVRDDQNENPRNRNDRTRNDRSGTNRGTLELPEGVDNITSIDAINTLIAETSDPETGENRQHVPLVVRHVYSGGIARLFGGDSMPTEEFISPAFNNGNNAYGNTGTGVFSNGGNFNNRGLGQGFNQGFTQGFNGGFNQGINNGFNNGFNNFNGGSNGVTTNGLYNMVPTPSFATPNLITPGLGTPNFGDQNFGTPATIQPNQQIYNRSMQPARR